MNTTITAPAEAPTLSELAGYCYDWFERFTRDDDGPTLYRLRDGAPEWLTDDMIRPAHGDMLPDDHKYEMIATLLGAIHDSGAEDEEEFTHDGSDHDACESCVSHDRHDRYAWLSSNLSRVGYVEEFYAEFGGEGSTDPGELAARGWYMEAREVLSYVLSALRERLESIRDEMPDPVSFAIEASGYGAALAEWREEFPEVAVIEASR